jgi:hypothetical protein
MSTKWIEWTRLSIWQESKPKKVGQSLVNKGFSFGDELSLNFILGN